MLGRDKYTLESEIDYLFSVVGLKDHAGGISDAAARALARAIAVAIVNNNADVEEQLRAASVVIE